MKLDRGSRRTGKLGLLLFLFCSVLYRAHPAQAQNFDNSIQKNYLTRSFRESGKLTFTAGAGGSVMSSDYRGVNRTMAEYLKIKGYGFNASIGAIYQVSPYVGVLGNVDYFNIKGYQLDASENDCAYCTEMVSATGSVVLLLASKSTLISLYDKSFRNILLVPYLKGGIGLLRYRASSYVNTQEETPSTIYPDVTVVVPVGGGLRLRVADRVSLASEFTLSIPFSDYLDNRKMGGSTFGVNDTFGSISLKVFYTLGK